MDDQKYKIKVEFGVSAVTLLVGVFFVFQAFTIDSSREAVGPRTMPMILAWTMVVSGVWLGVRAYLGRAGDIKDGYGFAESDLARISMVVGCGALFVLLFWAFGFFVALIFTLIAMFFTFGVNSWPMVVTSAIILAFVFQALFMGVMRLNDPKGAIVDMRPYTNWITGAK